MIARGFVVALQFLTRLPVPPVPDFEPRDLARAAPYFPLVGLIIGTVLAGVMWSLSGYPAWIGALCAVVAWIWITGALHLDGLGDVADALGAAHKSAVRLEAVLNDPHAGNFAIVAIATLIIAKLVMLAQITHGASVLAVVLVPAWARWGALLLSTALPPLKPGRGAAFGADLSWRLVAVLAVPLIAASIAIAPPLLAALAIVALLTAYWRRRLGGVSGDVLGASIEITETLLLLALVMVNV